MASGIILGVDPSLTACAIVAIIRKKRGFELLSSAVISTPNADHLAARLIMLQDGVRNFAAQFGDDVVAAVETPPQGSRMFSSAVVAKATGACEMGLWPVVSRSYTAQAVKRFMVPTWPGLSKENWKNAGYTKAFRRSMPSKTAVSSRLAERFGIYVADMNTSDACAIAVYHSHMTDH